MKAKLKELKGKYYKTIIEIDFEDGFEKVEISFGYSGDFTPSKRELESQGYTEEQWENNEMVYDGWGGLGHIRNMDIICDNHFESKTTYERALKLIAILNT
jgi:hypothetical protein